LPSQHYTIRVKIAKNYIFGVCF